MSGEEKMNSSNSTGDKNSSQNNGTKAPNTNFAIPGNVLAEIHANYNSALRGAKGLAPDWGYNVKAATRMAELASQNLKGLGLASLHSTSSAYKNIASMKLPDTKSYALAAKILSGFPNHNDKVAERLKKICEPSFKAGQILSELAAKSDWANNAVGKNFLKYDIANINNSFNNSAIADIIKRNDELSKQFSTTPVAGYYRDLLKRGNILSQFNKSLDSCKNSLVQKKEEDFKSCVEELRKVRDKISLPQYKIPETQIQTIDARLNVLSSTAFDAPPPLQTRAMAFESVVEIFIPALSQIMKPSHDVLSALNRVVSERLSATESVLRSQLEITEKLLGASQLTQQNIEALVSETKTNNNEIKKLLEVSKENTETVKQQLVTAKQNSKSSNRWAWASCILSIVAISIAVWSECSDKTEELIDIVKKSHPWSEQQLATGDAKNISVAFQAIAEVLQKYGQLEKDNIELKQATDRLQADLKKAQDNLTELQNRYNADKVAWTQEKENLCAEITALKKKIEELNAELAKRPLPSEKLKQEAGR